MIGHTLGIGAAIVFAVALYAAGQSSTITGVLAGRILSRGFQVRSNWSDRRRALVTRLVAGAAAVGLLAFTGGQDPDELLVLSQVILSLALPFALGPLVVLACRKSLMGQYVLRGAWAWAAIAATVSIIVLDGYLLVDMVV
ncbi:Divalent metal cation transporter MntH [compost metagenome]